MGAKIQAFDIFQTPLSSHYPLPLSLKISHHRIILQKDKTHRRPYKMSSLKKIDLQKGLSGKYLSVWGPEPHNPFPYTLYMCNQVTVYLLFTPRRGGEGESWTREKGRGATVHKAGSKKPPWLIVSSVCLKVLLRFNFLGWRHFSLVSIKLICPHGIVPLISAYTGNCR